MWLNLFNCAQNRLELIKLGRIECNYSHFVRLELFNLGRIECDYLHFVQLELFNLGRIECDYSHFVRCDRFDRTLRAGCGQIGGS